MQRTEPKAGMARPWWFESFRRFRVRSIVFVHLLLLLAAGGVRGQEFTSPEYQIKAAFVLNFAKFVEWPPAAFPQTNSPIFFGILGKTTFVADLEKTIRGKTINDRPLAVKEFQSPEEATNCHVLFISNSEKGRLPEILKAVRETNVLTVSEMDRFTESGGMINFLWEGNKVRFEINEVAAKSAGLKVSAKLLSLSIRPSR